MMSMHPDIRIVGNVSSFMRLLIVKYPVFERVDDLARMAVTSQIVRGPSRILS